MGVKGRIQTRPYEDKNGDKKYITEVVAEKITFLSTAQKKEESAEVSAENTEEQSDPFKDFADEIEITDDMLPY